MNVIFLDDDQERHDAFEKQSVGDVVFHVYNVPEFRTLFRTGVVFDIAYLDHDLGDFDGGGYNFTSVEITGLDAVKFLVALKEDGKEVPFVVVHSWNPIGAKRMCDALEDAGLLHAIQRFSYE